MENDFLQWLVAQGGVGGLAAFALWMLNRVWTDALLPRAATQRRAT